MEQKKIHSFCYRQLDAIKIIMLLFLWKHDIKHILAYIWYIKYIYLFVYISVLRDAQLLQSNTRVELSLLWFIFLMVLEPLNLFTLSVCKCVVCMLLGHRLIQWKRLRITMVKCHWELGMCDQTPSVYVIHGVEFRIQKALGCYYRHSGTDISSQRYFTIRRLRRNKLNRFSGCKATNGEWAQIIWGSRFQNTGTHE